MTDITVLNADGDRIAVALPLEPGRAAAAASKPIALSTEDLAAVNAITTALATNHTDEAQLHTDIATTLHADLVQLHSDNSSTRPVSIGDGTRTATIKAASTPPVTTDTSLVVSIANGGHVAIGATTDGKSTATDSTSVTTIQILKQISFCLQALATGLAGTRVETTVAAGGTAANLFGATPTNGFEVINPHATETLYIRENGTATVADNSTSVAIPPKAAYTTPHGYKPIGDVSYIAATTGHAVIARRW